MNTIREVEQINQQELERGIAGTPASWHAQYRNSPWVYVGNLDHQLTEGDVLCVMSQFGEIEDINLAREEDTGKSRGFAFCKYEDARSCILAVDNLVGVKLCGRSLRVDHMEKYRLPKKLLEQEEAKDGAAAKQKKFGAGHAYQDAELANRYSMHQGQDLFAPPEQEDSDEKRRKEEKKQRKEDKLEKKRKREERRVQKEEERRKHRADRLRKGHSMDDEEEGDSKDDRRKHRKRKHRREHDDESSEDESRRRRKSHKHRRRDRDDSSSSRKDRRDRRRD